MARLPPPPSFYRWGGAACGDPINICVSQQAQGDILRHCNCLVAAPSSGNSAVASEYTLFVGLKETKLWLELRLSQGKVDNPISSLTVPTGISVRESDLPQDPDDEGPLLRLQALQVAGGVIEMPRFSTPLELKNLPVRATDPKVLSLRSLGFWNRPKGLGLVLKEVFGVSQPIQPLAVEADAFQNAWVCALPTRLGARYVAILENMEHPSKPWFFRYSDVAAHQAWELLYADDTVLTPFLSERQLFKGPISMLLRDYLR
ncbi:hypothetical protein DACRYDRAFT_21283 [Dacryopinax primogenitus]|uniref:Uncharacterized protein n=1 Tax=Dacryopinax primogenitus (strain DJM 731) TaxID=1858805 RepID=M5GF57_DACPD|nr:uncharacterized protein DACRYDRAFT_21283 [Dacryopinax primogenitus]EJU03863.1 hypothetical protein DACRYDRAFT_21283 [Dacryopinax primogenitus]